LTLRFIAGWSGLAVDTFGCEVFFTGTAMLGLPVLVLLGLAARAHAGGGPPKASA